MKSIFRRFVFIYLALFVISFGLIVVGVRFVLDRYFFDLTTRQITTRVLNYQAILTKQYEGNLDPEVLNEQLFMLAGYTGSSLMIIDEDGHVYGEGSNLNEKFTGSNAEIKDEINYVINGGVTNKRFSYVSDSSGRRMNMVRVGVPLRVGSEKYAVFANVSTGEIEDTITRVSVILLLTLFASGSIAIVLIFVITSKMSKEIKNVSISAGLVASGRFDSKIRSETVDELSELADSFNKMADDIMKQENARRNFISGFSHDIRTPLTTIKGYTTGILDGTIDRHNQEKYLNIVVSECDRMINMSNNLLELAKFEAGELPLEKTDFDLNSVIANVLDSFESKIKQKQIDMVIDLSDEQVYAHADVAGIQRVIYNLLDNATKFVEQGGTISVRTELINQSFYIGIGNSGKVLSPEERQRIWNRFEKLDISRGLEKSSSGLGLSIVREIIRAHGERIDVYSNEDIGVAFIFTVSAQIFTRRRNG